MYDLKIPTHPRHTWALRADACFFYFLRYIHGLMLKAAQFFDNIAFTLLNN